MSGKKGEGIRSALPCAELELPEWRKDIKVLKKFFQSYLWKYPVHTFIGEIVKGQFIDLLQCLHNFITVSIAIM